MKQEIDPTTVRPMPKYRSYQPREIQKLRDTVAMLCNFIWTRKLEPGQHLWTIPVDEERDFDCILLDAIDELEELRAEKKQAAATPKE